MFWLLISIINLCKELRFLSSVRDSFVVSTGTRANTFEWSQMNNGLVKNRWKSHNRFMRCKLFVFSAACSNYTPSSYCFWTKITKVRNSFESDKISLLTDWVSRVMKNHINSSIFASFVFAQMNWIQWKKNKPWSIFQYSLTAHQNYTPTSLSKKYGWKQCKSKFNCKTRWYDNKSGPAFLYDARFSVSKLFSFFCRFLIQCLLIRWKIIASIQPQCKLS